MRRPIVLSALLSLALAGPAAATALGVAPTCGYEVVRSFPHDPDAFTEGLFVGPDGVYESTGLEGRSGIRRVRLETGEVLQRRDLDARYFGEGIVAWGDRLIQLTWRTGVGFVYDLKTFAPLGEFHYPGEGWALTHDGRRLIMSDGTPELRFLDPVTLAETGRLRVSDGGRPVADLNELEFVRGDVLANVWQTDRIARIDLGTGRVKAWIDLSGLIGPHGQGRFGEPDVLNGVAYDAGGDHLYVTGKNWPRLFEIRLVAARPKGRPPLRGGGLSGKSPVGCALGA